MAVIKRKRETKGEKETDIDGDKDRQKEAGCKECIWDINCSTKVPSLR